MIVYAIWDASFSASPRQAELVALWRRSWLKAGWVPRIMLGKGKAQQALSDKKGKVLSHFGQIARRPVNKISPVAVGAPGWDTADVVDFGPNADPELVSSIKC